MQSKSSVLFGIIILLLVIAFFGYLFWKTMPNKSEIDSKVVPIKTVNKEVFKGDIFNRIKSFQRSPGIPVDVNLDNKDEFDRENPFAKY
jgi:hypothetical protein